MVLGAPAGLIESIEHFLPRGEELAPALRWELYAKLLLH
jgi:hypothetical protein